MRDLSEIRALLDELEHTSAEALEDQDLDFKEWNTRSMNDAVSLVIEMAIAMANGGGGTVVFGVNNKAVGRRQAILGVPPEVNCIVAWAPQEIRNENAEFIGKQLRLES